MKNWDNLKEQDLNLFTSQSFLTWLSLVAEDLTENETLINASESEKDQDLEELDELHDQLVVAQREDNEELAQQLEQQIHELEQEKNGDESKLAKIRQENTFLYQQLTTISQTNFLTTRKESALDNEEESVVLTELEHTLESKSGEINDLKTRLLANHTKSSVLRRSSVIDNMQRKYSSTSNEEVIQEEENDSSPSSPLPTSNFSYQEEELHKLLTRIEKRWNNHLTGVETSEFYQGQEQIMNELLPYLETALEHHGNAYQWLAELVTKWKNDYPSWVDTKGDLFWLEHYLKEWNNTNNEQEQEKQDELAEVKLELVNLKKKLLQTQQEITQKTAEWIELSTRSDNEVKRAIKSTQAKFANFINPVNLEAEAKERLNMVTQEELNQKVNEALIPLKDWESTFSGKTPSQVQEELATAKSERSKYRLERKQLEIERDDYKEDSEKRIKEIRVYYNEYLRVRDLLSKERDRVDDLEEQIYSLGYTPIPEPEEEENQAVAEQEAANTSEVNENNTKNTEEVIVEETTEEVQEQNALAENSEQQTNIQINN